MGVNRLIKPTWQEHVVRTRLRSISHFVRFRVEGHCVGPIGRVGYSFLTDVLPSRLLLAVSPLKSAPIDSRVSPNGEYRFA